MLGTSGNGMHTHAGGEVQHSGTNMRRMWIVPCAQLSGVLSWGADGMRMADGLGSHGAAGAAHDCLSHY
jgi:hypothetical protein